MSPGVSLQVKRIIEPFAAERTQVPLRVAVTLHVTVQEPLQRESLAAHATRQLARVRFRADWRQFFDAVR